MSIQMQRSGQWLEIVTQFDDAILDVVHLDGRSAHTFTCGSAPGSDLVSADLGDIAPLAAFDGLNAVLTPPPGATIFVEEPTGMRQLDERSADSATILMKPATRYLIEIGAQRVYARLVDAGTACPRLAPFDWRAEIPTVVTGTLALLLLFIAFLIPPTAMSLAVDMDYINRQAVFMTQPPVPEPPKPIPGLDKDAGGGARAAKENGKAGTKTGDHKMVSAPVRSGTLTADARAMANAQAQNQTILQVLHSFEGSHTAAIFNHESVLGDPASQAMNGLSPTDAPGGYGNGGAGDAGNGPGGGGKDLQTIGLDRIGTGPGKGPGGGGYGPGIKGALTRTGHHEIEWSPGPPKVTGGLDKELIRRVVRQHVNEVKFCYEKQLQQNVGIGGRMKVQFMINAQGNVIGSVAEESMGSPSVDQCIVEAVRRWQFPRPQTNLVSVSYPFFFKSAGTN